MTNSRTPEAAKARRSVILLFIVAALFCWGVAFVVGGTIGVMLAILGLLGLISGALNLKRT